MAEIKGADILITGGTGFLAHGLVRQLLADGCERICIYSRNEFSQARMRMAFNDDERLRFFVGDVRDKDRLQRAMGGVGVVIAAAALKRIEAVEYNILEAVQTNVAGTENTVKAAIDAGVEKVVLISTDKAADPKNGYGFTKALAEKIVLSAYHYAGPQGTKFAVCRFGNIVSSTGSVIPTWLDLIKDGKEVSITDPECTRFFQTRDHAVQFVLDAVRRMQGGELFIPQDLPAYRLGDLAEAMGANARIIGLGEYEKRHEMLKPGMTSENARRMSVDELRSQLERL